MLDLFILIFLVIRMGRKARRKGLNVIKWRLLTVAAWIGAEMLGIFIGIMLIAKGDITVAMAMGTAGLYKISLIGIVSAFGGYLLVKYNIDKYPDLDDDINTIGQQ